MGGYAAIRAGLALRADTVLAFGPQVVLDLRERAALSLRASPFDRSLRALEAEGKAEGFALTSLLEVVRHINLAGASPQDELAAAQKAATVQILVYAGGECAGDLREAALLEKEISARWPPSAGAGAAAAPVRCSRITVPGSDHAVAAAMRSSGLLHEVLCDHCL